MRINPILYFITVISIIITISGCAEIPRSFKERTLDDMYPILTQEQYHTLDSLTDDAEISKYLDKYWKDIDTTSGINSNDLKTEYSRRLEYANAHYPDYRGWGRSIQKKIYLLYGPPCFIDRYECTSIKLGFHSTIKSMEIWTYSTPGRNNSLPTYADDIHPGEMRFIFADIEGCGIYSILYSSENDGDIDPRMFK